MTTGLNIELIRKQYRNGMQVDALSRLHDTDEVDIEKIVEGIEPKRSEVKQEAVKEKPKRRRKRIDPETEAKLVKEIRELAEVEHMSKKAISEVLDCSYTRVNRIVKDYGIQVTKHKNDPVQSVRDESKYVPDIMRLLKDGLTVGAICKELDITRNVYQRLRRQHGFVSNKSKGRPPKDASPPPVSNRNESFANAQETAVTVLKPEEKPELIGSIEMKEERDARILKKVMNRDKSVWGEYLTERRGDIQDITHDTKMVTENGKLIERTVISFTLEWEVIT